MKQKILIIDDSVVNINALHMMLKEEYQVYVAKNGKDGIKQANLIQPSLILLDILMPEMDGFQVLDILTKDSNTSSIPVMFITCLNDDKNEEKGLNLGAVDYITKPFNLSVIKAKVRNHIELFQYRKAIENIAMLDGLTGIPNRRSYDERIKVDWQYAIQEQVPISVAIMDIDCFKEYNDNYGHLQGDMVLKQVAKQLEADIPLKNGFAARYGGEEFVIVLLNYTKDEAMEILENVRIGIERLGIQHLHSRAEKVITVSLGGGTIIPNEGDDLNHFVETVDQRLYRGKTLGRNLLVWESYQETKGQLEIFLFGSMKIMSQNGEVTPKVPRKKVWVLFTYIILNRLKEYTKDDLVEAIWPYEKPEDPSYELKLLLEEMKDELEILKLSYLRELIITINGVYRWNNNYMCVVDCDIFENILQDNVLQTLSEEEQMEHYLRAIELYKAEFLVKVTDVKWIVNLQRWYRNLYLDAVNHVLWYWLKKRDYENMVKLCEKDLYNEDFNEELHYHYLVALIRLNRRKEALAHYEYIVESYYSILGVPPAERILDLYIDIVEDEAQKKRNLRGINDLLKEHNKVNGAYYCEYVVFKNMYQLEARNMVRTGKMVYLCLLNLQPEEQDVVDEEEIENKMLELKESISNSLRMGDCFCRYSTTQYMILLPTATYDIGSMVIQRILTHYKGKINEAQVSVEWELVPVEPILAK